MALRRVAALLFALALVAIGAIGARAEVVVRDDRGVEVAFAAAPRRVVSLLPSLTESVCAIGACDRLVATDRFSNWPASVEQLPKLGGLDDAPVERIAALKPDVVLVSSAARIIGRLEALGFKVVVLETRNGADTRNTLRLLAQLFDKPGAGDAVWSRIETEIGAAAKRVPPAVRGGRVYFEIDSTPYAAGPESFVGEMLARLGMGNILAPDAGPFPKVNPEFVVRAQPDVIMASKPNLQEMRLRPGWASLRALERGQACGFEPAQFDLLTRPGPRMGEAAGVIADCLVRIAAVH
ncbi:MAG: ABC transporter substrate-binding protein [Burkholderiaceae bacterium]|nr:ABC transporter substrate-binding protein [Burkholderiaceae bacterium]